MKKILIIGVAVLLLVVSVGGIYLYNITLPDKDNINKSIF